MDYLFKYDRQVAIRDHYVEKTEFIKVKPSEVNDLDARIFTFNLDSSDLYMYDMQNITLSAMVSIGSHDSMSIGEERKTEGKKFDPVTFSNLMLDTCFEKVTVLFNDQPVLVTNLHPFRSFVEKALSYTHNAKETTIASQFYHEDTVESLALTQSVSMIVKADKTRNSQAVYISTKLSNDAFNIVQYMPASVKITVQLQRSIDAFSLLVDTTNLTKAEQQKLDQYFVVIRNPQLTCKRVLLTEEGQRFIHARVQRPLCFTFPTMKLHTVTLPGSITRWDTALSLTRLPGRIFVGLVDNDCIYGSYTKNSLYFKHFNLTSIVLKRDGMDIDNLNIEKWDSNGTMEAYNRLLYVLKATNTPNEVMVTPKTFLEGPLTLFPLIGGNDLTGAYPYPKGNISLTLKFGTPLATKGLTAIIFSLVDSELTIDNTRVFLEDIVSY